MLKPETITELHQLNDWARPHFPSLLFNDNGLSFSYANETMQHPRMQRASRTHWALLPSPQQRHTGAAQDT